MSPQKKALSRAQLESFFSQMLLLYPDPKTELNFKNEFELLIAVILSAQCTDARVNQVTPALFKRYPTAQLLSTANQEDVEQIIHSCGFYKNKAQNIIKCARELVARFNGKVPSSLDDLTSLAGVGRKTASVVLNQAYDIPAIAVDTHVKRVAHRLGWTQNTDPTRIEFDLRKLLPEVYWAKVNTLLILHGRKICGARRPKCEVCPIQGFCSFYKKNRKRN